MNAAAETRRAVDALPLDKINVADPRLYQVVGAPVRAYSNFLRGIKSMPVRIAA